MTGIDSSNPGAPSDPLMMRVSGGQVPAGRVCVSGAKNSATRLLAAAMLTDEPVRLHNFPTEIVDARVKADFLEALGAQVHMDAIQGTVDIRAEHLTDIELAHYHYPIRTTYLLAAGQLYRNGIARIPYPGGCRIGERKYDLHTMLWKNMGCTVTEKDQCIEIRNDRLQGCEIAFPFPTIGGTENALLCAALAQGTTVIRNAYVSPEILDLITLLRHMGADISMEGSSYLIVHGVNSLHGTSHEVMPDRIEALTWIIYGVLSRGRITIEHVPFHAMETPLLHLRHAGVDFFQNSDGVHIDPQCVVSGIQPFELACGTHPGVISDMQPFFVLLGLKANGRSRIVDYRYPERTAYLEELRKFCPGAIEFDTSGIRVRGPVAFQAAQARSTDLRGSMALVLAALLAEGESHVHDVQMALRGYNRLPEKLAALGVQATFHPAPR